MAKFKAALLIILLIVLVDFAYENAMPAPMLRLFKFNLGQLPTFLLAYLFLALGLFLGWLGHVMRIRKKRRLAAAAASAAAQQQQEAQQAKESQQASG